MITLTIDGKKIEAENKEILLKVALENNIDIPHLCYHKSLESFGACRLCIVEVIKKGQSKIVASCTYPIEKDIEVITNSPRILKNRKMIIELLLARCSNVNKIKELAFSMGVTKSRFKSENNDCILCGLCSRTCEKILGISIIDFSNRGIETKMETPFNLPQDKCIGCGACAYVCPINTITIEKIQDLQKITKWQAEHNLIKCKTCGNGFMTEKQMNYLKEKFNFQNDIFENCPNCKRKEYAKKVIMLGHI